jgi:hypothetical protein
MGKLIDLINQHALSAAQAGNWQIVADTLNSLTTEVRDHTLRSGRWLILQLPKVVNAQTGMTESDIVLGTLQQSTIPRVKAAYDSLVNGGIDLSDDQVQQMIPLLAQTANWPAGLAEKILTAGRRTVPVLESPVTAADCAAAWLVNADCLLSINRTNGVLRVCLHVYRDGHQVRLAVINEGEGSEADRALANGIEAALDQWLQVGG